MCVGFGTRKEGFGVGPGTKRGLVGRWEVQGSDGYGQWVSHVSPRALTSRPVVGVSPTPSAFPVVVKTGARRHSARGPLGPGCRGVKPWSSSIVPTVVEGPSATFSSTEDTGGLHTHYHVTGPVTDLSSAVSNDWWGPGVLGPQVGGSDLPRPSSGGPHGCPNPSFRSIECPVGSSSPGTPDTPGTRLSQRHVPSSCSVGLTGSTPQEGVSGRHNG